MWLFWGTLPLLTILKKQYHGVSSTVHRSEKGFLLKSDRNQDGRSNCAGEMIWKMSDGSKTWQGEKHVMDSLATSKIGTLNLLESSDLSTGSFREVLLSPA